MDSLDVSIAFPQSKLLSNDVKRSLCILDKLGVHICQCDDSWDAFGVPGVVQICRGEDTQTLFTTTYDSGIPGEGWLQTNNSSVWVSTTLVKPFNVTPIDMARWDSGDTGATVLDVVTELNGPVSSLSTRLNALFQEAAPSFAKLIEQDRATEISYSDRYLKSPWSLMVLSGFLSLFKNDDLHRLDIKILQPKATHLTNSIKHDWSRCEDLNELVIAWLQTIFSVEPRITMVEKSYDLQHSRVISIFWASGKKSKIILDQGVGYWQPKTPYREQTYFDFNGTLEAQALQMADRYKITNMTNGGAWPTFLTIVSE